jgi:hypothetical protein
MPIVSEIPRCQTKPSAIQRGGCQLDGTFLHDPTPENSPLVFTDKHTQLAEEFRNKRNLALNQQTWQPKQTQSNPEISPTHPLTMKE